MVKMCYFQGFATTWVTVVLLIQCILLLSPRDSNGVQAKLPPVFDMSQSLERLYSLRQKSESTQDAMKILEDRVRLFNPDFFANGTYTDRESSVLSSSNYHDLGCDMAAAIRPKNNNNVTVCQALERLYSLRQISESMKNDMKILEDRVRLFNPDFFANGTYTDRESSVLSSSNYHDLGCDMAAAIRPKNNNNVTTHFTFQKLEDGLGNFVIQLVKGMAFAYQRQWNFLGVRGALKESYGTHGTYEIDILNFYFGNHVPLLTSRELFPNKTAVKILTKGYEIRSIFNAKRSKKPIVYDVATTRFHLDDMITQHNQTRGAINQFLSPVFLSHLRTNAQCGVKKAFSMVKRDKIDQEPSSVIKVVAHIRAGDVLINDFFAYKRIPLEYYPLMFSLIQKICPLCKFYAFTSVQHNSQLKSLRPFISKLENMNVTVYVDKEFSKNSTDEALNSIAHLSTADVLITAKSEFSIVAAYLNPNCVIYSFCAHNFPLQDWVAMPYVKPHRMIKQENVDVMLGIIETKLPVCMKQKLAHKKLF